MSKTYRSRHVPILRQSLRLPDVIGYIGACPDRYFVTLTTSRRLDAPSLSREVSETIHRVNAALFGTAYRRHGRVRLATYAVQERTFAFGLHAHLLIGVPEGALALKPNPPALTPECLVINTWCDLDPAYRRAGGQDARPIFDLAGIVNYIHKDVFGLQQFDAVDLNNTAIPSCPPSVPLVRDMP